MLVVLGKKVAQRQPPFVGLDEHPGDIRGPMIDKRNANAVNQNQAQRKECRQSRPGDQEQTGK